MAQKASFRSECFRIFWQLCRDIKLVTDVGFLQTSNVSDMEIWVHSAREGRRHV